MLIVSLLVSLLLVAVAILVWKVQFSLIVGRVSKVEE